MNTTTSTFADLGSDIESTLSNLSNRLDHLESLDFDSEIQNAVECLDISDAVENAVDNADPESMIVEYIDAHLDLGDIVEDRFGDHLADLCAENRELRKKLSEVSERQVEIMNAFASLEQRFESERNAPSFTARAIARVRALIRR